MNIEMHCSKLAKFSSGRVNQSTVKMGMYERMTFSSQVWICFKDGWLGKRVRLIVRVDSPPPTLQSHLVIFPQIPIYYSVKLPQDCNTHEYLRSIKVFPNKMSQFWSTYMSQVVTCDQRAVTDDKMWRNKCHILASVTSLRSHVASCDMWRFYTVIYWRGYFTIYSCLPADRAVYSSPPRCL